MKPKFTSSLFLTAQLCKAKAHLHGGRMHDLALEVAEDGSRQGSLKWPHDFLRSGCSSSQPLTDTGKLTRGRKASC